jgi:hypothetical protein
LVRFWVCLFVCFILLFLTSCASKWMLASPNVQICGKCHMYIC